MVQLKSFKYIEPEVSIEERKNECQNSVSSLPSTSSMEGGGNLTSESSRPDGGPAQGKPSASSEDTLSSSEEYQLAQLDIPEEENDEASSSMRLEMSSERVTAESSFDLELERSCTRVAQPTDRNCVPRTPLIARHQLIAPARLQAGPPRLPGSVSPLGVRQGDSVSQLSFGQSKPNNHFEIRWRNINLRARKSKLPRFVTENQVYKYFKRDKMDEKVWYSPPVKHRTGKMQPTIDENLEMSSRFDSTNEQVNEWANDDYRPILSNVSGSVFSAQLTAVLGPSGVGKTSLLNSLTGRNTLDGTGTVSLLGGVSKRMSVVNVPQADVLPGKLTTIEDLRFTSRLKNPQRGFNHKRNIDRIVRHLHMDKFLDTRIEKLSGGEARRLSIARELLSSPDIMILDEPTSGLDANTCKKIITALRDIVEHSDNILDRPMSIIITIHQPQKEVLNLFHRVYVMALGGRAIYEGSPANLLPTILEQSSLSRVCANDQLNENPAIVAIEVASGEFGFNIIGELAVFHESQAYEESLYADDAYNSPYGTPKDLRSPRKSPMSVSPRFEMLRRARINSFDGSYGKRTPNLNKRSNSKLDNISGVTSISYASTYDAELPEPTSRLKVDKRLRRSVVMKGDFVSQTWTLMERCWLQTTRDMFLMAIRVLGFLLVAGGMVQIFSQALDPKEDQCPVYETEVDDLLSFIHATKNRLFNLQEILKQASSVHLFFFHLLLCITMVTSALTGLVFPMQMRMFIREYKNGWYSPASFITSHTLAELPIDMIGPLLTVLIVYPLCNQPPSEYHWREIGYILVIIIMSIICKSQAQIVGAFLMDSVENSVFISCVMVTPPALLSGIAVRVNQMAWPLQILSYGSFLRYGIESMFLLRYGYGICPCDPDVIRGYPTTTSLEAIPPQLDRMARGFLELNLPANETAASSNSTVLEPYQPSLEGDHSNLFLKFIRIVNDAANLFVPEPSELGNCDNYRSLYLMIMDIKDRILPKWVAVMLLMFLISRILTYFAIKTVIKMRR